MADGSKVQVAVRLRPMNKRELDLGTKCVVDMEDNQTILYHPDAPLGYVPAKAGHIKHQPKTFAYDYCFWSVDDREKDKYHGQHHVFSHIGKSLLQNAFGGYNACMFAYGQTGSGKSYTMMGTHDQKGIIPLLCDALFAKIDEDRSSDELSHTVEVSYMEIYNEKVHDLLDPNSKGNLKVREHKILGPYVDGLSQLAVNSYSDIENLMVEGNKSRTVAATNMNSESSRSHAVFTIKLTQTLFDRASGVSGERVAKISLVDLAGSERVTKTGAIGERLKEGSNINKSLSTLGLVIKALAEQSCDPSSRSKKNFVPYRDSVLTWLLKDNLGGNSKTVMIATISPAADNYEETLSTLRYADSAKRIVNHAVVNEDPNARIIRELRTEVEQLRHQLQKAEAMKAPDLKEKLEESEKLIEEMSKTWEEKLLETEKIHKERHLALESMGISVETSGIKVESDRCYLVNLNADPSLNELLVYYLKEHTRIGTGDDTESQDIQLKGLGIFSEHCTIDIENGNEVYVSPVEGARTCINGSLITARTRARHGDRILWGNNHFFRLNIPRKDPMSSSAENAEELHVDYEFAQQEIMMQAHDPIQESIEAIERQYENDKQAALEAQKEMYEEQMMALRSKLVSPGTPVPWNHYLSTSAASGGVNDRLQRRIQQMAQERNNMFKPGLSKLKEELVKANVYAREANQLAQELSADVKYNVTMQIPASNLSPNRRRSPFVSEPAILARDSQTRTQVFTIEEFGSQIVQMREVYQDFKDRKENSVLRDPETNPFAINALSHDLIGVANVFLDALFYDVKLDYYVAIINQQGEVAGRLHVELSKLDGSLNDYANDTLSINSDDSNSSTPSHREIRVRVAIKEAKGLPPALSNFVFCQYTFWGHSDLIVVAPKVDEFQDSLVKGNVSYKFDHVKEFVVPVTEDFTEHLYDGALSIEVYGHFTMEGKSLPGRSLADRWSEVTRKLELLVDIQELNDMGEYQPVEVQVKPDVYCGGVFQLRQGYSRRIVVHARPVVASGSLPLTIDGLTGVSVGGLSVRSAAQKGMDSYQEEGLGLLRSRWNEALEKRKLYLDDKMHALAIKEDKSEPDAEREKNLMSQWLALSDERNSVLLPQPGSGVPGAPAEGDPAFGMEHHSPVIFLDLNADDMTRRHEDDEPVGETAVLDKEVGTLFLTLPVVHCDNACIVASWDSSIHDSIHLNRLTPPTERVYMIVKIYIRLSHPAPLDLTVRKRICINVYKRQSLTDKLRKKITQTANTMGASYNTVGRFLHVQGAVTSCGIRYDIVSCIPKASEELEDRETMAKLAATGYEAQVTDGESYIEKYIKSVAAVESIFVLDRLGQEVAIKDSLMAAGRSPMRTNSSPNISALLKPSSSMSSFSDRMKSLSPLVRMSESFHDLSKHAKPRLAGDDSPAKPAPSSGLLDDSTTAQRLSFSSPSARAYSSENGSSVFRDNIIHDSFHVTGSSQNGHQAVLTQVETTKVGSSVILLENADTSILHSSQAQPKSLLKTEPENLFHTQEVCVESALQTQPCLQHKPYIVNVLPDVEHDQQTGLLVNTATSSVQRDCTESNVKTFNSEKSNSDNTITKDKLVPSLLDFETSSQPQDNRLETNNTNHLLLPSNSTMQQNDRARDLTSTLSVVKSNLIKSESSGNRSNLVMSDVMSDQAPKPHSENSSSTQQLSASYQLTPVHIGGASGTKTEPTTEPVKNTVIPDPTNFSETHYTDQVEKDTFTTVKQAAVVNQDEAAGVLVGNSEHLGIHPPLQSQNKQTAQLMSAGSTPFLSEELAPQALLLERGVKVTTQNGPMQLGRTVEVITHAFTSSGRTPEPKSTRTVEPDTASPAAPSLSPQSAQPDMKHAIRTKAETVTPASTSKKDLTVHSPLPSASGQSPRNESPEPISATKATPKGTNVTVVRMENGRSDSDDSGSHSVSGGSKSRAEMLNDIYSVNALDELEALGDSMDSCDSDVDSSPKVKEPKVTSSRAKPQLVDESDDSDVDQDEMSSVYSFGSQADLSTLGNTPVPSWVELGAPVIILSTKGDQPKTGYVHYVGETEFAHGTWIGVQLDTPHGKNDGTVGGISYFDCKPKSGVFVRHDRLLMDKKRPRKAVQVKYTPPSAKTSTPAHRLSLSAAPLASVAVSSATAMGVVTTPGSAKSSPLPSSTPSFMRATAASKSKKK